MSNKLNNLNADARQHSAKIKSMLNDVIEHVRQDIDKVDDVKARVLFETTAEVLIGLKTTYHHFESRSEKAMQ